MTNKYNKVLYTGVTNDLMRRVAEHNAKINKGFTGRCNCDKLVYFEVYDSIMDAIRREKQLKNWKRQNNREIWRICMSRQQVRFDPMIGSLPFEL